MSLLKRIFKAPAPTLQDRIEALDTCATEQLMDICLSDESEALREAAIGRLSYTQTLRDLATDAGSSRVRLAARKRIGQLLEEHQLELAQLSRDLNDDHQLLALIAPRPFLVLAGESGPGAADGDRSWPFLEAARPVYELYDRPARLGMRTRGELLRGLAGSCPVQSPS
jgi:hypothetical protein